MKHLKVSFFMSLLLGVSSLWAQAVKVGSIEEPCTGCIGSEKIKVVDVKPPMGMPIFESKDLYIPFSHLWVSEDGKTASLSGGEGELNFICEAKHPGRIVLESNLPYQKKYVDHGGNLVFASSDDTCIDFTKQLLKLRDQFKIEGRNSAKANFCLQVSMPMGNLSPNNSNDKRVKHYPVEALNRIFVSDDCDKPEKATAGFSLFE